MVKWSLKQDEAPPAPAHAGLYLRRQRGLLVSDELDRESAVAESRGLARVGILVISDRASRGEYQRRERQGDQ